MTVASVLELSIRRRAIVGHQAVRCVLPKAHQGLGVDGLAALIIHMRVGLVDDLGAYVKRKPDGLILLM